MSTDCLRAALILLAVGCVAPAFAQEDDAALAAVLGQVAEEMMDESLRAEGGVACLSIDPGGAPQSIDREFLAIFADQPFVRRGAECEARPSGAVEIATDRPAVLITAGPIEWVADDEAWVTVQYFRTTILSAQRTYRAVREESGWVSLGQIIRGTPV